MSALKGANLALRFLLELCALAAVAYWGSRVSSDSAVNVVAAIAAPLALAALWGTFLAPKASRRPEPTARWLLELVVLGVAVAALATESQIALTVILAATALTNAVLLHVWRLDADPAR